MEVFGHNKDDEDQIHERIFKKTKERKLNEIIEKNVDIIGSVEHPL